MVAIITSGSSPKTRRPGLNGIFGNIYNEKEPVWSKIYQTIQSNKSYEESLEQSSFGLAAVKPQGGDITFDTDQQVDVFRTLHTVYGLGFIVTEEEKDDNLYAEVAARRTENLAFSMRQTKELIGTGILNRAFLNTATFGVNNPKELCATDHVTLDGTQSNELSPAADISEAAIEDLVIQIMNAKNSRGLRIGLMPERIIVPNDLFFDVTRILESQLRTGTSNNDVNVLKLVGTIPEILVNPYLDDPDAFFIQTNARRGLIHYQRKPIEFAKDNDFSTSNMKFKATERYSFTAEDFRCIFGSEGAA